MQRKKSNNFNNVKSTLDNPYNIVETGLNEKCRKLTMIIIYSLIIIVSRLEVEDY